MPSNVFQRDFQIHFYNHSDILCNGLLFYLILSTRCFPCAVSGLVPIFAPARSNSEKLPTEELATLMPRREDGGGGGHCWYWLIYKLHDEFSTCLSPFL